MKFDTILDATREWVGGFNAIPYSVVAKLAEHSQYCDIMEITPPKIGDMAYFKCDEVEIIARDTNDIHKLIVRDKDCNEFEVNENDLDVERDSYLPMWGTLWSFDDNIDDAWLDEEHIGNGLHLMADCGFRIYESEDYGYIFGIDGCGYDFYESHWIPLYKARGLKWHK